MGKGTRWCFYQIKEMFLSTPVIKMPDMTKPFFIMTGASLTTTRGVLMQKDPNGDLHPCTYHSVTFSPVEQNDDIYDREFLAVIQALKERCHYLIGTEHPVTVITDHKNLGYFKQPQNLTRQQAHWMLFLQNFHIKWEVEQGINMGPADTLSRKNKVDTDDDNWEVILLKGDNQLYHIQAIDSALAERSPYPPLQIQSSPKPSQLWMTKPESHGFLGPTSPTGNSLTVPYTSNTSSISLNQHAMTL